VRFVMVTVTIYLLAAGPALAQVSVEDAWARATPPGAKLGAAYLSIRNGAAAADRLVGASTPAADRVELHSTVREGDVARMRQVKAYDVPAGGRVELKPGGSHLMLVNLKAPLKEGEKLPISLKFEKAGELKAEIEVRALGAASHEHHHGH
jgi:copper(I)-binding protein